VRNPSLLSIGSLVAALAVSAFACTGAETPVPRNLLLITLDTLRADHLGVYGYDRPTSPALDAFAMRATVFEDVTCSVPTTLPSHVSIFTGLRPLQHGVRRNGQDPPRDLLTIFDLLAERGAATAAVIASKVLQDRYLAGMGFDELVFPGSEKQFQTPAKHVTNHAAAWLERNRTNTFALWVHYFDTHEPYAPPRQLARAFDRGYDGELPDALTVKTLVGFNDLAPDEQLSRADLDHITDLYDAEVAYLDSQLARLLDQVETLGLLEVTLIVIVGDHGQALGENAIYGHGLRLLEGVIKVPLIFRAPDRNVVSRVEDPVETVDIVPTLVDLLDLPDPAGPDLAGRSLAPALAGEPLPKLKYRFIERRAYPDRPEVVGVALHGGDWKAVYYRDEDGSETRSLSRQAHGLDGANLYEPESQEAQWLETAWTGLRKINTSATELDEEQRRMLQALGYLD
jgi:arylsulfatase A-like enzyme